MFDKLNPTNSGGVTGMRNPMNSEMALGKIIRYFKAKSTAEIRSNINPDFEWLSRYHDWIIRNDQQLSNFRKYIRNNPLKWNPPPHRRDSSRL